MELVKAAITAYALELGFDAVGFCKPEADEGLRADLRAYLEDDRHGDMAWMAANEDRRGNPAAIMPEARTIIVLATNYGPKEDPRDQLHQRDTGAISVYARGRDYHNVLKKRLKILGRWMVDQWPSDCRVFVDTAPVMEKPVAMRAGIGWQGKHTNLVSRRFGSWLFLSEVFTTLDLAADAPEKDACGNCRRCIDACPTHAITHDHRIDPRRCVSYLTIEHKSTIPEDLRAGLGNRIYGCDDCLAACPWNKFAEPNSEPAFADRPETLNPDLGELAMLDDTAFRERFAASPIKRTGRDRFVRNVLVAIANSGNAKFDETVLKLMDDPSPLVSEAAVWAAKRLDIRG